jgi:hypothetical protein
VERAGERHHSGLKLTGQGQAREEEIIQPGRADLPVSLKPGGAATPPDQTIQSRSGPPTGAVFLFPNAAGELPPGQFENPHVVFCLQDDPPGTNYSGRCNRLRPP